MKTKIIIAAVAVIVIVLAFLGIRYRDKFLPGNGTTTADTQQISTISEAPGASTTVAPFVEAQTQIISGETTKPAVTGTTEKPTSKLITSNTKSWPKDEVLNGLPKPDVRRISESLVYKTNRGKQIIIRFDEFGYNEFLDYIARVEKAGFADKNSRYHIPESEPANNAMFYYSFDGERSFGIYWHGKKSPAGFDCEIVVCDYDQAK